MPVTAARRAYLAAEFTASEWRRLAAACPSSPTLAARADEATVNARRAYATLKAVS